MAWTVAFALLGALIFSIVIAPVLASFAFAKGAKEWHNPVMDVRDWAVRIAVRWAIRHRVITVGVVFGMVYRRLSGFQRGHRIRIFAALG
jgi:cobalt-zinc-cadmium resistance protein CzcA